MGDIITDGVRLEETKTGPGIYGIKRFLDKVDTSREPVYSIGEVAKFFFRRKTDWVRWREAELSEPIDRSESGARRYTLGNIEDFAHSLHARGVLNGDELAAVLLMVKVQAILYGYLCRHSNVTGSCRECKAEKALAVKAGGNGHG